MLNFPRDCGVRICIRIDDFVCFSGVLRGDFGRLGHGNSSDLFLPHPIQLLQGLEIKQIACGDSHCLAISIDGEAYRYFGAVNPWK